ncbi:MAG: bifunctional diaminohydroxyphosphoribosylaminopyrimidine deaminase/5-amino-6-(5-phosphoribosylamino)uracil reductase RibD [Clostridium sp.]
MDKYYMSLSLEEAKKGIGSVNPNPLVGAIIVKNGEIIGRGYHEYFGRKHAEINAIESVSKDISLEGSTIYVNLEPCFHKGKTGPCVQRILKEKFKRVVIGMLDPNPLVSGKSIKLLREKNVQVTLNVLEEESKKLNEIFLFYIKNKKPFVILKSGVSLDGKIQTKDGNSKWITSEESRRDSHEIRNLVSGIMVGVNTVIEDNPSLTCRGEKRSSIKRIIVDSKLRVPKDREIFKNIGENKVIIGTTNLSKKEDIEYFQNMGIFIILTKEKNGQVDLKELIEKLGEMGIDSILLEGGGTLNYSALKEGIVNKVMYYVAPIILGGSISKTSVEGEGVALINEGFKLENLSTRSIGQDILIEGYLKEN